MDGGFAEALIDASPVALLVVDAEGTITYASPSAEAMTGYGVGDVEGTSIFGYLVDEAVTGIIESVGYVTAHPDVLMGPLWVGFRHADGELRVLEILARNRYDDPLLEGLVVAVRDHTTQFRLNEALTSHGQDAEITGVLEVLARAVLGLPVRGRAAFVDPGTGAPVVAVRLPDELFGPAPDGQPPRPWQQALASGEGVYPTTLDDYDPALREVAAEAGLTTVWAHPVRAPNAGDGPFASCLVVGRVDPEEVTLNEQINVELVVRNAALVFERDFYVAELSHRASSDALTGLANRAHLLRDRRADADERDQRGGGVGEPPVSTPGAPLPDVALYVDLDGFKEINDRLGHRAGDAVLVEMAARLRRLCRRRDELGRIGGDEFVLLLWDAEDHDGVVGVAERVLAEAARPIVIDGPGGPEQVHVGASVGIAATEGGAHPSLEALLHAADQALYEAKREGRGRWRFATAPGAGAVEDDAVPT